MAMKRLVPWALGVAIGLLLSVGVTRLMTRLLVDVKPTDPTTYVATTVLFFAVAILACGLPARRASRLSPTVALRDPF